ncbi:MAG: DUF3224 domain-containing protein [Chloroflexota bacterium]
MQAKGTFAVNLKPLETYAQGHDDLNLGRMSIDKTFEGELQGTSQGEMLTAVTPTQGSAGYVAIEQVQATLHGKSGSFVLQHSGLMNGGRQQLMLQVVPDSGSGDLTGLSGDMHIEIKDGQHFYEFDYTFDAE